MSTIQTEEHWRDCTNPIDMLEFLQRRRKPGQQRNVDRARAYPFETVLVDLSLQRKLRLIACGFCRRLWYRLPAGPYREAVEMTERYADGAAEVEEVEIMRDALTRVTLPYEPATREKILRAMHAAMRTYPEEDMGRLFYVALSTAWEVAELAQAAESVWQATTPQYDAYRQARNSKAHDAEQQLRAAILRDVIPSPFRDIEFDPEWASWRDQTVTRIARSLYEDHRLDELPILADALEEAGCTEQAIIDHCRQPGPHVRGCWVLDLLLGKS